MRITATARLGEGEVIDIEREAELGGALHSRGDDPVVVPRRALFAQHPAVADREPGVRTILWPGGGRFGIAGRTVRAAVGAGRGADQAVAGGDRLGQSVRKGAGDRRQNEKIEGFFDLCRARDLDGEQGCSSPMPTSSI